MTDLTRPVPANDPDYFPPAMQRCAWQPIETAPRDSAELLVYTPDDGDGARMDFDYREDGVWALHAARYEEFMAVGGAGAAGPDCVCVGPSEKPAYTHWMPLPDPPTD